MPVLLIFVVVKDLALKLLCDYLSPTQVLKAHFCCPIKHQSTFSRVPYRSDGGDQEPSGLEPYYCYWAAMYSIWRLPNQLLCSSGQSFSELELCRYWPPTGTWHSFHYFPFHSCGRKKKVATLPSLSWFITYQPSVRAFDRGPCEWASFYPVAFLLEYVQEEEVTYK